MSKSRVLARWTRWLRRPTDTRRRSVLRAMFGSLLGLGFTCLGCAGALWSLCTTRFFFPNAPVESPSRFRAGFPEEYPRGFVQTQFTETHGVWVIHGEYAGRWQIYALRTECTHLGCIVMWQQDEQRFKCPCHGSAFYLDGINYEGPAPRPLERCAIRIADDGQLEVDTHRVFRQELGQWDDPECYVVV